MTSFIDDRVVRVDLESGEVIADISVPKPTGIAIGFDGSGWSSTGTTRSRGSIPTRTRSSRRSRLANGGPATCAEVHRERGRGRRCGLDLEQRGPLGQPDRPESNEVTATIDLPFRVWAVSAGGGSIWASQFEDGPNGGFGDMSSWTVARIDQTTGEATSYPVPAMSVSWGADALWTVVPGRRGNSVVRLEVDQLRSANATPQSPQRSDCLRASQASRVGLSSFSIA